MIVAKESKAEGVSPPVESSSASGAGASASTSAPIVVMSPPRMIEPTPVAHHAPPAYSDLPTSTAQPPPSTRVFSDGPTLVDTVGRDYATVPSQSTNEQNAGRAIWRGLLVMVAWPIVAFLATLWGVGKVFEGIGKGICMGPEAAYQSYQSREERRIEKKANRRSKARNPV